MTAEHKRALAQGRAEGRAVRSYLEALDQNRPPARSPAHAGFDREAPEAVEAELADAAAPADCSSSRSAWISSASSTGSTPPTTSPASSGFVKVAKGYAERKGISYAAWRELGVSPDVLRKAGIGRGALSDGGARRACEQRPEEHRCRRRNRGERQTPARGAA